ncbi:MAG: NAD-dependent epimerase/dehydratase family protein [Planctomycetaceae bacterium]|nr:NAD-dependent epimerase/dehydratase family protein [Planctomycetaceae bacterium]
MTHYQTSLSDLLGELRQLNVRLRLNGGELKCDAPRGVLGPELVERIREHRNSIVALLRSDRTPDAERWRADIRLPEEICPVRRDEPAIAGKPDLLMTGATGFLGGYLLTELLNQCESNIHCLVRAGSRLAAESRIKAALERNDLWRPEFHQRVRVVVGDLGQKHFGVSSATYKKLIAETGKIIHNGAYVHHGLPYEQLKSVNVDGTRAAIEFACEAGVPLHYVSSLSVFPSTPIASHSQYLESDPPGDVPAPSGGYNLSKWVAEHLVFQAAERGLDATIYRPGPISGHSETGEFNRDDFLQRLMQGYIQSGIAPDGQLLLDILPVDYVGRAIAWLSCQAGSDESSKPVAYHLFHPQPVSSDLVFEACQNAGYTISRVSYQEWFAHLSRIVRQGETDHALYALAALFSSRQSEGAGAEAEPAAEIAPICFDDSRSRIALATAPFDPPILNASLFQTYLRALIRHGVVNPPLLHSAEDPQATELSKGDA